MAACLPIGLVDLPSVFNSNLALSRMFEMFTVASIRPALFIDAVEMDGF